VRAISDAALRGIMARSANYVREVSRGRGRKRYTEQVPVYPPGEIVHDVGSLGTWPFPPLDAITRSPGVRPDGTLLLEPGYDPATRLYYHVDEACVLPPVPEAPSPADVAAALELIWDVFCDFPFVDQASRANTLALLLTPIVRPAIGGPVLLATIDAPMAGTGKSLLADVVSLIATGSPAETLGYPKDEEEMRKKITSALRKGATLIAFDNVVHPIESAELARALTSRQWSDRELGGNEMVTYTQCATWVATGNNIRLGGDMARRCYRIHLDAQTSEPESRKDFKHPRLLAHVGDTRGRLLWGSLVLVRYYYSLRERPAVTWPRVGSFEAWCDTLGGILAAAGVEGFMENLAETRTGDESRLQWEAFLRAWLTLYGDRKMMLSEVVQEIRSGGDLRNNLPDDISDKVDREGFVKSLGRALLARRDFRHGRDGIRVERCQDTHKKTSLWSVHSD